MSIKNTIKRKVVPSLKRSTVLSSTHSTHSACSKEAQLERQQCRQHIYVIFNPRQHCVQLWGKTAWSRSSRHSSSSQKGAKNYNKTRLGSQVRYHIYVTEVQRCGPGASPFSHFSQMGVDPTPIWQHMSKGQPYLTKEQEDSNWKPCMRTYFHSSVVENSNGTGITSCLCFHGSLLSQRSQQPADLINDKLHLLSKLGQLSHRR